MTKTGKIGIIAGAGQLPLELAQYLQANNQDFVVGTINNITDCDYSIYPNFSCALGEFGKRFKNLKSHGVTKVTFLGKIPRPDFSSLKLDTKAILSLPKLLNAAKQGDDALMRVLLAEFEKEGFEIAPPESLMNNLKGPKGSLGKISPNQEDLEDIKKAKEILATLGPFDIGQGCVVNNGIILAIEAQEGTDNMLKNTARLSVNLLGSENNKSGVLVKMPKSHQDTRIDLPGIGLSTLENAKNANLKGIAYQANGAIIAQRQELIEAADLNNMFIYCIEDE